MPVSKAQQTKNDRLFDAVRNNAHAKGDNIVAVRAAIAEGADVNARSDPDDVNGTVLQTAIRWKNMSAAKELLRIPELNINAQDNYGWTALHCANHQPEYIEILLKHPNVDINLKNEDGKSPWDNARHDVTASGNRIRSLFASKEGVSWEDGEKTRGNRIYDYSHRGEARLR